MIQLAWLIALAALAACSDSAPPPEQSKADPRNVEQVALGRKLYEQHCSSCHGARLEGQPDWQEPLPNGRMRAPPHDESGHTWHHPDCELERIVLDGMPPRPGVPTMPAFSDQLDEDDIEAILAHIKTWWEPEQLEFQQDVTAHTDTMTAWRLIGQWAFGSEA
jgi:S-disulfanyl-L-cysteine oxidoreductase SoxD